VTIYTDGACLGNPGPGGYGVVLLYNDHRKEISGGFRLTTNNRMEIYAAIAGLSALNCSCEVTLFTDSRYLADAMNKGWVRRWKANGWMRNNRDKALNVDLWERLLELCERHKVKFVGLKVMMAIPKTSAVMSCPHQRQGYLICLRTKDMSVR